MINFILALLKSIVEDFDIVISITYKYIKRVIIILSKSI